MRWRFALPALGLILFSTISYRSYRGYIAANYGHSVRFIYWSRLVLDSHPPKKHSEPVCDRAGDPCVGWDIATIDTFGRRPVLWERAFVLSGLPAFAIGILITYGLGSVGVNEVLTFMISTPPLVAAWFYFLGWLVDRHIFKRSQRTGVKPVRKP
jgi:hypothetical protein